jgi:hypothetical protein
VIDLNAWPSFALFRPVAAAKIAALLASGSRAAARPERSPHTQRRIRMTE